MNIADTMRGFVRRWYIVLPGIILAVAAGLGTFVTVQPGHERTSTQLLLPGSGIIPVGTTNPYLFLGGLTQAADVVVRVMRSDEVLGPIVKDYPGTDVVVERDPTVSGPVVQITVTGKTDDATEKVLAAVVKQTAIELDRLQTQQDVAAKDRISVSTLTLDTQSTLQQKTRILASAGVVLGVMLFALILASLIDGLARRPHKAGRRGTRAARKSPGNKRETAVERIGENEGVPTDPADPPAPEDDPSTEERTSAPVHAGQRAPDEEPGISFDDPMRDDEDDEVDRKEDDPRADDADRVEAVGVGRGRAHHRARRT